MRRRIGRMAVLVAVMLMLCSCAGGQNQTKKKSDILELKIGSSIFAPYFYVGENGEYTGADVEIATEACERIGYQPVFTELTWGEHDKYLDEKTVDCLWSSFSMDGREDKYRWAGPYLESPEYVVVSVDSGIYTMEDLAGKSVAVQNDSTAEAYFLGKLGEQDTDVQQVMAYTDLEDAFVAFGKGYADAVASHVEALTVMTSGQPTYYRYLEPPFLTVNLGVAFRKDEKSDVVDQLTKAFDEMNEDGTIQKIAEKYGISQTDLRGDSAGEE